MITIWSSILKNRPLLTASVCIIFHLFTLSSCQFILIFLSLIRTYKISVCLSACLTVSIYLSLISSFPSTLFYLSLCLLFQFSFVWIVTLLFSFWISGTLYQRLENGSQGAVIDKLYSAYLKVLLSWLLYGFCITLISCHSSTMKHYLFLFFLLNHFS